LNPSPQTFSATAPQEKHFIISQWVTDYGDEMYGWACSKISNEIVAQDLVQDTFVSVVQAYDSFLGKSNPKTWLFSILRNKIIDHYRTYSRMATTPLNTEERVATHVADHSFSAEGRWTEHRSLIDWGTETHLLDNAEFSLVMTQCFRKLPESWSAIINAKFILEKESEEICQELGITPSNYWQVLHRAKLALKKCLEHNWFNK